MNVAHFISSLGIFGAENVVLSLAQYRRQHNQPVCLIGIDHPHQTGQAFIEKARALGIQTHSLKSSGRFDTQLIHQLQQFLQDNQIDILHTHNYKSTLIGALAARKLNIGLVATVHGYTQMNMKVSLYETLDKFILRHFFHKVVVVREGLLKEIPPSKRVVIRNGIDTQRFSLSKEAGNSIRQKFGILKDDFVIGSVGRLSPEKNQKLLLDAAAGMIKHNPKLKLLLVGDGPERENLKAVCRKHQIEDHVIWTGIAEDTAPLYQAMDVFVLSSLTEGIPLTILEAMASSRVVVATRVGGIPQIVHDQDNGLLVDSGDVMTLKAKLEWLIKNPSQRANLAQAGAFFVKQECSLDNMCQQYERVYTSCVIKS
jgi:glycosyltransferase involved in cell wall biosynthesis